MELVGQSLLVFSFLNFRYILFLIKKQWLQPAKLRGSQSLFVILPRTSALRITSPTQKKHLLTCSRHPEESGNMSVVFTVGDPRIVASGDASESSLTNIISPTGRAQRLVGNELFSDATFLVGPDEKTAERIPVHTIFLKMASDSFAAMFSGKFKKEESIRIPDHSPSAVYSMMRWIYCEELVFEAGKLTDVLRIARLYLVDSLISMCFSRVHITRVRTFA